MIKMILQLFAGILLAMIVIVILFVKFAPQFGARSKGVRLERIQNSPNFRDGKFQNLVPTTMAAENTSMFKNGLRFLKRSADRSPAAPIETIKFDKEEFLSSNEGFMFSWFGHSSLILNLDGNIILTDPVFSEYASPVSFMGVKRFNYTNQFLTDDLPEIDLVLISHDHFDHLDYKTIQQLHQKVKKFFVPLGVAAHLIHWGVPEDKITEFDWWDENSDIEGLRIISAPARHFSGRSGFDKDYTLWCSYIITTKNHHIYFNGDSGYGSHFKQIGDRFGPFELAFMECGQYNEGWPYIHMMPEQSVQASRDLNANIMMPIHWGKFNLSLHSWTEPLERAKKEAQRLSVELINPIPGQIVGIVTDQSKKSLQENPVENAILED